MPQRQIIFYLEGEIEAEVSDGEVWQFGPGSVTLVEDTTGKGHRSRVLGSDDVDDSQAELERLRYWLAVDRFDRRAVNHQLRHAAKFGAASGARAEVSV